MLTTTESRRQNSSCKFSAHGRKTAYCSLAVHIFLISKMFQTVKTKTICPNITHSSFLLLSALVYKCPIYVQVILKSETNIVEYSFEHCSYLCKLKQVEMKSTSFLDDLCWFQFLSDFVLIKTLGQKHLTTLGKKQKRKRQQHIHIRYKYMWNHGPFVSKRSYHWVEIILLK